LSQNIPDDTMVYADINMLHTIIRNLLSNAIKFSYDGGKISLDITDYNKDFYNIIIIDEGTGISEADMQKLFKIDVKHSTRGTSMEKGTGLGLIICKDNSQNINLSKCSK
jgi:two-component system sensor histidine kinase/response regulator